MPLKKANILAKRWYAVEPFFSTNDCPEGVQVDSKLKDILHHLAHIIYRCCHAIELVCMLATSLCCVDNAKKILSQKIHFHAYDSWFEVFSPFVRKSWAAISSIMSVSLDCHTIYIKYMWMRACGSSRTSTYAEFARNLLLILSFSHWIEAYTQVTLHSPCFA